LPYWFGTLPEAWVQPIADELTLGTNGNARGRKERVVVAEELMLAEKAHPVCHDRLEVVANWAEVGQDSLAALGPDFPRVLVHEFVGRIKMLETERGQRADPDAGQRGERQQRPVPTIDIRL